jgi:hypothetical protein
MRCTHPDCDPEVQNFSGGLENEMPRNSAPPSSLASATRIETIHGKTIYATDLSAARPLSAGFRKRVAAKDRTIRVGHVEETKHGTLRCERESDAVVVVLRKGKKQVGRKLMLLRTDGSGPFPEAAFSVEVDEFIGTPWHELEYTSLWTVHGLRTKGEMEGTVDR